MITPRAVHVDLYDRLDKIPFAKLEAFFKEHLKLECTNGCCIGNKGQSGNAMTQIDVSHHPPYTFLRVVLFSFGGRFGCPIAESRRLLRCGPLQRSR
jgi:hypothetical protein